MIKMVNTIIKSNKSKKLENKAGGNKVMVCSIRGTNNNNNNNERISYKLD